MAVLYGGLLGGMSALLLVSIAIRVAPEYTATPFTRAGLGLAAWLASAWLVSARADRVVSVFRRGFLLGAAEWLALSTWGRSDVPALAAEAGGQLAAVEVDTMTGGVAVVMIWLCLLGWAICRWSGPRHAPRASAL